MKSQAHVAIRYSRTANAPHSYEPLKDEPLIQVGTKVGLAGADLTLSRYHLGF